MERNIYRRAALERLSNPEQLDQLVRVTGPLGWLALAAVAAVLAAAAAWAVVGTIATGVGGAGVLVRHGGNRAVVAAHGGQVVDFRAAVGDVVSPGQVLAGVRQYGSDGSPYVEQPVVCDYAGRVVEVAAGDGDVVQPGTPLLTVEPLAGPLEAVVFVPAAQAKRVRPGAAVRLSPSTAGREEYGFLRGTVRTVGDFAATRAGMMHALNNDALVDALRAEGTPVMIIVDLTPDPFTPSGYKWSSSSGPPAPIVRGTLCAAKVTVREDPPIRLVIPTLRSVTGL